MSSLFFITAWMYLCCFLGKNIEVVHYYPSILFSLQLLQPWYQPFMADQGTDTLKTLIQQNFESFIASLPALLKGRVIHEYLWHHLFLSRSVNISCISSSLAMHFSTPSPWLDSLSSSAHENDTAKLLWEPTIDLLPYPLLLA